MRENQILVLLALLVTIVATPFQSYFDEGVHHDHKLHLFHKYSRIIFTYIVRTRKLLGSWEVVGVVLFVGVQWRKELLQRISADTGVRSYRIHNLPQSSDQKTQEGFRVNSNPRTIGVLVESLRWGRGPSRSTIGEAESIFLEIPRFRLLYFSR